MYWDSCFKIYELWLNYCVKFFIFYPCIIFFFKKKFNKTIKWYEMKAARITLNEYWCSEKIIIKIIFVYHLPKFPVSSHKYIQSMYASYICTSWRFNFTMQEKLYLSSFINYNIGSDLCLCFYLYGV